MPLDPVQPGLILDRQTRFADAVAEANHVGDHDAAGVAVGTIADVDVPIRARVEVIRAEIDRPVADAAMIDRHLRDAARVSHAIELIGRPIAAGTRPRVHRIETGLRNRRPVTRVSRFGDRRR